MNVVDKIDSVDAEKVKRAFKDLLTGYLTPAFGSIAKRDFDILLFMKLQDLGIIEQDPEMYELVTNLKVTRAKARTLLYEAKLRSSTEADLDEELKNLLRQPIFLKDKDKKIGIEVENPFLIDHLRFKLKKKKHITDGSFSPELVKLTPEGYISLLEDIIPQELQTSIQQALIDAGATADTSFTGVVKSVLKKIGSKVAGDAGDALADSISDYLSPIIDGSIDEITTKFSQLFSDEDE